MRLNFIIFFSIFFAVYGLVNLYILVRGWQSIPPGSSLKTPYLIFFLFVSLSFIAGRFIENVWTSAVSNLLIWIGSFWLAAMLYLFLAIVLLDILRLINHWLPVLPSWVIRYPLQAKQWTALSMMGVTAVLLIVGHLNTLTPRIRTLDILLSKNIRGLKTLNIVVASDIHLGTLVGRTRLDRIAARINELKPDLILLPGDIVDEDLAPVIRQNMGDSLTKLKARWGVFAITGNHEYIGGVEEACRYLEDHGVTLLGDTVIRVNDSVTLIGREDRSIFRFSGKRRKPLVELMDRVDRNGLVILMDHQPFQLEDGESNGIDLQLSGHTHHGQMWPLNFVTEMVYELSWGYKKKNDTHIYVSCGVGTWGPPVRLGNRPEIVNIRVHPFDPSTPRP
jgi:predicted MPP superfamily phosphohydrolase